MLKQMYSQWSKIGNVDPIYKTNDEKIVSSANRPVSAWPIFSKLMEKLIYGRLIHYINEKML